MSKIPKRLTIHWCETRLESVFTEFRLEKSLENLLVAFYYELCFE